MTTRSRHGLLVLPLLAFLVIAYLAPVTLMLARTAGESFGFEPLRQVIASPVAVKVFLYTLETAVWVTLITLVLAYPLAFFIATARALTASILMAVVLVPFWTSILIRSYAWMVLLGRKGIINELLVSVGLLSQPLKLLNTGFAVYIGMVHVLLPFMILPILASLKGIDGRLVAAAENLGAGPVSVFRHVILPLSMPGVLAGTVLVFVLALGFYITPALLGGPSDMTISMLIAQEVDLYRWDVGAAMAALLLVMTLVALLGFSRFVSLDKILGGAK
ncbi:putative spermidine/putrescine transport system permease protein [Pseudaminobacter salicylatoxidans]|uniref:Putative spermidine/putrescine transport system permease protein n=1 Tax=Pseudaminobacter salicylatoxidans TaxID=93369 RepID=A0A316C924_PSESE|nr:ABC transporter permease [Pseudaminobacter salicylatoxidans]PWJ86315.1 putative spermidine/putrescine transport system permease protein [Pseudaminobacter salicylatoxidans]